MFQVAIAKKINCTWNLSPITLIRKIRSEQGSRHRIRTSSNLLAIQIIKDYLFKWNAVDRNKMNKYRFENQ